MENLKIVRAEEFIKSLNGSFPLQKFIEGFLPEDVKFSLNDEIRVDEAHIQKVIDLIEKKSVDKLAKQIYDKVEFEIKTLLRFDLKRKEFRKETREFLCISNATYYDHNFHVAGSKLFLTEEKKHFVTKIIKKIMNTTTKLINNVSIE